MGARDVPLLLDRIAETDPVGRRACGERELDLGDRGRVEARAEIGEQAQDLGRRIGLNRVEHPGVRQRAGEAEIIVAHDVEIDDEAWSVLAGRGEELLDAIRHGGIPGGAMLGPRKNVKDSAMRPSAPRDGDAEARSLTRRRDRPGLAACGATNPRAISSCAVADARPSGDAAQAIKWPSFGRGNSVRTPGKKDKPL